MKSEGNSFGEDGVLESVNMEYRGVDSILDQIYEKQIFLDLYYEDFQKFKKRFKKMQI